jgi:hypothetical protein
VPQDTAVKAATTAATDDYDVECVATDEECAPLYVEMFAVGLEGGECSECAFSFLTAGDGVSAAKACKVGGQNKARAEKCTSQLDTLCEKYSRNEVEWHRSWRSACCYHYWSRRWRTTTRATRRTRTPATPTTPRRTSKTLTRMMMMATVLVVLVPAAAILLAVVAVAITVVAISAAIPMVAIPAVVVVARGRRRGVDPAELEPHAAARAGPSGRRPSSCCSKAKARTSGCLALSWSRLEPS